MAFPKISTRIEVFKCSNLVLIKSAISPSFPTPAQAKTSLAEAMLFDAGAITRMGNVADGTTASDYDPDEIKHKISINLTILPATWKNNKINIIDTPGYPDFVGEVKSALRVCESAVILVCAASGVEVGTEQVWSYALEAKIPRLIFMNKMDRENANFAGTLEQIQNKLSARCLPIQIPIGSQKEFQGHSRYHRQKGLCRRSCQGDRDSGFHDGRYRQRQGKADRGRGGNR